MTRTGLLATGPDSGLWLLDARTVTPTAYAEFQRSLDARELSRAQALTAEHSVHGFVIAHGFVRQVLGDLLGRAPGQVEIDHAPCARCGDPHGKPRVHGLHHSMSRAHDDEGHALVLVAVGERPIGVDIEHHPAYVEDVARMLHPDEHAEITAHPDEAVVRFTRAWTRTEALLKGIGVGLHRGPDLDYVGTGPDPVREVDRWRINDVEVPEGWCAAVAVAAPDLADSPTR